MSVCCVFVPVVVTALPALAPAIAATAASMGYAVKKHMERDVPDISRSLNHAEVDVKNAEIVGEELGAGQSMQFERDGVTIEFSVNTQGQCKVCVSGDHKSKSELQAIGQQAAGKVIQMYTYNRVVTELKNRDFQVDAEQVDEEGAIRLKLKRYE